MKRLVALCAVVVGICVGPHAQAVETSTAMGGDHRVQEVPYEAGNVVKVLAAKGVSLLIVLNKDEKITAHSTGFDSNCDASKGASWCIIAQPGTHLIWVKPLSDAKMTDLQVVTNKRIYSFELDAESEPPTEAMAPTYRLVFTYPQDELQAKLLQLQAHLAASRKKFLGSMARVQAQESQLSAITAPQVMQIRNTDYVVAAAPGSGDIKPSEVFDDGRFEYLKFGAGKSVPAVFAVSKHGTESQVNWFWKPNTDYMVLTRLYAHIILRENNKRVGIWNKDYHGTGAAPRGGTTHPGVVRLVK